jgi:hypothetical protein
MTGGFQSWSLSSLETTLGDRAEIFGASGYRLETADFGPTFSYGLEMELRLTERWFLRAQGEWTRLKWEDRDRQFLASLGGRNRTPISVGYQTRVQTRPVLFAVGAGTARELWSARFALSGSLLIAPMRVVDDVVVSVVESRTETQIVASGTGTGFELDLAVDYFTEVRSTLYVEAFLRRGGTTVSLDDDVWETTAFPSERRVDLDGFGIRLGLRWI